MYVFTNDGGGGCCSSADADVTESLVRDLFHREHVSSINDQGMLNG
jgi:hypothetical protein